MEIKRFRVWLFWTLLVVLLLFSFVLLGINIVPLKVDPAEVTSCSCIVDDTQISFNPMGYDNPINRKAWKITTKYDRSDNTLYETCWLRQSFTYSGIDYESSKINRADFGEIDKVVPVGGFFGQKKLTIWEDGACTLPPSEQ